MKIFYISILALLFTGIFTYCSQSSEQTAKESSVTAVPDLTAVLPATPFTFNPVKIYGRMYYPSLDKLLDQSLAKKLAKLNLNEQEIIERINESRLKDQQYFQVKERKVKIVFTSEVSNVKIYINGFELKKSMLDTKVYEKTIPVFPDSVTIFLTANLPLDQSELKASITVDGKKHQNNLVLSGTAGGPRRILEKKIPFAEFQIQAVDYDKRLHTATNQRIISPDQ